MPIESSTTTTAPPDESVPEVSEPEVSVPETTLPIQIVRLVEGNFVDRSHPTAGTAVVLNDGTEQRFLRFEKFATDNGPDLNVYLSVAPVDAPAGQLDDDFVDLGDLKGNVGAQNYEIPTDVDLGHYSTVVIWCVRF
ncbi:MAG: DM13 domain-containing protein, partial [Acidimicrobiia bacterium]|nr:DM13 domain-containing protein [Acidimicrobiia bacterium]